MLTRAARSEAQHRLSHQVATSFNRLQLPWLCPAVTLFVEQQRKSFQISNASTARLRKRRYEHTSANPEPKRHAQSRRLATDAALHRTSVADFIPFENVARSVPESVAYSPLKQDFDLLRPFNTSDFLPFPTEPTNELDVGVRVRRRRLQNIPGDVADIQQNLYACVHVGRHDRAAALVRRLEEIYHPKAPELLDAHNQYLSGLLESLLRAPSSERLAEMQKWFEIDVRGRGASPDSATISIMIKAAMSILDGGKLDRTIRRYLYVARTLGMDVEEGTLASGIYSDSEWSKIVRLLPEQFEVPPDHVPMGLSPNDSHQGVDDVQLISSEVMDTARLTSSADHAKPKLMPVQLKGFGLAALRKSLSTFQDTRDSLSDTSTSTSDDAFIIEQQKRLERDVLDSALERWHAEAEQIAQLRNTGSAVNPQLGTYMWEWLSEIVFLIKKDFKYSKTISGKTGLSSNDGDLVHLTPFLGILEPEKLTAAALLKFIGLLSGSHQHGKDSQNLSHLEIALGNVVVSIGKSLREEIIAEFIKNDGIVGKAQSLPSATRLKQLKRLVRKERVIKDNTRSTAQHDTSDSAFSNQLASKWSDSTITKLGAYMMSKIIEVAKLPVKRITRSGKEEVQIQSMASQGYKFEKGKKIGTLLINSELIRKMTNEPVANVIAKHLPMLVEPKKWTGLNEGGFLTTAVCAIRLRDSSYSQEDYIRAAIKKGDMKQVFHGLDVISKVAWRINAPVFDVMTAAWNSGQGIGGLAPRDPEVTYPPEPTDSSDRRLRQRWQKLVKELENEKTGYHSQRCYQNFQLEVARHYLEHKFYCPHNMDFRGRAYPIPPYFNHLGADHCRGLLTFARGKELGETGLTWLKIHVSNVYGYDKASLTDREEFTMSHISDIYDSATDPLTGRRWWLTAEDPWQCLSACMELKNALESPVPSRFVSHLPVHQDGTCNGLQHYAALGGDVIGAKQVNLEPGDKPADIYTAVSEMVREDIAEAAEKGDKASQILNGVITRKVVKQTVMTNVYGVTYHGARLQVANQLVDILPKPSLETEFHITALSGLVAHKIFKALSTLFGGAHAIQNWLGECGGRISQAVTPEQVERILQSKGGNTLDTAKSGKYTRKLTGPKVKKDYHPDMHFKSTIVWTTPLGMPVVQPYRKNKAKQVNTNLQAISVKQPSISDPVSKRRQLQAFPPNFIHSLDATHMLLSAMKCDEIGLTFASVHDSFWTHAADVSVMNRVLRDAFVRMHSEPIIGRLREEFCARYKGCLYRATIDKNSSIGRAIMKHRQTCRAAELQDKEGTTTTELLVEYKRQKLLNSTKSEEQQQGRDMITPASIFELSSSNTHNGSLMSQSSFGPRLCKPTNLMQANETLEIDVKAAGGAPDEVDEAPECVSANRESRLGSTKRHKEHTDFWLPLTFPAPPEKGSFDVSRLRDSQYFFS